MEDAGGKAGKAVTFKDVEGFGGRSYGMNGHDAPCKRAFAACI